jgi:hypothetical protein
MESYLGIIALASIQIEVSVTGNPSLYNIIASFRPRRPARKSSSYFSFSAVKSAAIVRKLTPKACARFSLVGAETGVALRGSSRSVKAAFFAHYFFWPVRFHSHISLSPQEYV